VTLFMTLLAAFQLVLARYSGQREVVVGTDVANRNRLETEGLIGFFINQLVLRTDFSANPSWREILQQVRETVLAAYAHQDVPFEKLVEELQPQRDLSRSPLFQVKLVFQGRRPQANAAAPASGLQMRPFDSPAASIKLSLNLMLEETADAVGGGLNYATELFDAATVERLLEQLQRGLEAVASEP